MQRTPTLAASALARAAAVLLALLLLPAAPSLAAPGTEIVGVQSGKCLDVTGNRNLPRTRMNTYRCIGQRNQLWTYTERGELKVFDEETCLDVRGADTTSPAVAQIYPCHGRANQRWTLNDDGSIAGVQSGLCLAVNGGSTADSALVNLRTCDGSPSQRWRTTLGGGGGPSVPVAPVELRVSNLVCDSVTLSWEPGSAAAVAVDRQGNASEASPSVSVETGAACANAICGVEEIARDSDIPWGLETLPDGTILYTRRDAHEIVSLDPETGAKRSIGKVPNVRGTDGEGGLLGLTISPDFASDGWLYLMHSTPDDIVVVRIRYDGRALLTATEEVLVSGIERNKFHDGGRLRFGPDGKLYASTGDAQRVNSAQDLSSLNGKILRMNPDGSVPSDNPFGNLVWSYGHRNPQGLAFDAAGRLWQQEFGNSRMDETNLIVRGGNYGWPDCEGTLGACDQAGFVAPKATYSNGEASCSGVAVVGDALYVACLRGTKLFRHEIDGTRLRNRSVYLDGVYGRLRTVEPAPGNGLWLTTSTRGDKDSTANNSDELVLRIQLGQ